MNTSKLKTEYQNKIRQLIRQYDRRRQERFVPFLVCLQGETDNPRYRESLAIVRYFLENAILVTKEDEDFYTQLSRETKNIPLPDYFEYAQRTPYPLADYLKVVYDLRSKNTENAVSGNNDISAKREFVFQIEKIMRQKNISKTKMAKLLNTSRASLDRLLDPNKSVTLHTIQKSADALGYKISLQLIENDHD